MILNNPIRSSRCWLPLFLVCTCLAQAGCLPQVYRIRSGELERLASLPAEERGRQVRVTQDLFGNNPPPAAAEPAPTPVVVAEPAPTPVVVAEPAPTPVVVVEPAPTPVVVVESAPTVETDEDVVLGANVAVAGSRRSHRRRTVASHRRRNARATRSRAHPRREREEREQRRRRARRDADDDDDASAGAALVAVVAATAVVAGAAVVGLAATEGARYDGWVSLDGKHPVHLRQGKDYRSTTLANLTAADVAWAQEAAIVPDEGPMLRLGRAPLSRRGFVYQCDLGAGMLNDPGAPAPWGFVPNLLLGGFPIQQFGILADVALGVGEGEQGTVFNGRYGVELQGFPLAYRRAHFGLYAQVGYAHSLGGEGSWGGLAYGGGGLFQVDITTRLALALRGGVTVLAGDRQQVLPEVTLGLAVY